MSASLSLMCLVSELAPTGCLALQPAPDGGCCVLPTSVNAHRSCLGLWVCCLHRALCCSHSLTTDNEGQAEHIDVSGIQQWVQVWLTVSRSLCVIQESWLMCWCRQDCVHLDKFAFSIKYPGNHSLCMGHADLLHPQVYDVSCIISVSHSFLIFLSKSNQPTAICWIKLITL